MIHPQDKLSDFILTGSRPKALSWLYAAISAVLAGYGLLLVYVFKDPPQEHDELIAMVLIIFLSLNSLIGAIGLLARRKFGLVVSAATFFIAASICLALLINGREIYHYALGTLEEMIGIGVLIIYNLGAFSGVYLVFRKDIKHYYSMPRWLFLSSLIIIVSLILILFLLVVFLG